MDKRCQNCEHYTGPREVKNGFLGVSVSAGYSDHSICTKTNHKASAGMACNCSRFEIWGKLQLELDKEKVKKEEAKHRKEAEREANRRNIETQRETSYVSSSSSTVSLKKSVLSEAELEQGHRNYVQGNYNNIKKLKIVPIIFTVLGIIMLIGGILCKALASSVANSNSGSSSYYAKQNVSNAETTSIIGTVLIVISILLIVVPWLIWSVKYLKAKKDLER